MGITRLAPRASGIFVAETVLPALDHRLSLAHGLHDLRRAPNSRRPKNNLGSSNVLPFPTVGAGHSVDSMFAF